MTLHVTHHHLMTSLMEDGTLTRTTQNTYPVINLICSPTEFFVLIQWPVLVLPVSSTSSIISSALSIKLSQTSLPSSIIIGRSSSSADLSLGLPSFGDEICIQQINPFKPELTIVILIQDKTGIAIAILDL